MTIHLTPAGVIGETFSLIECIEKIDQGADNLYIVDNNGNYTGKALPALNMRKLWYKDASSIVNIPAIPQEQLETKAGEYYHRFPEFTGFPVVNGGKLVGAVSKVEPQVGKYNWKYPTDPFFLNIKLFCDENIKIYLSSLEHEDIYNFYGKFAHRLPMTPISPANIEKVMNGENGAFLIYGVDVFPNIPKVSIHELWRECYEKTIERNVSFIRISTDVAKVNIRESEGLAKYIRHFDNGHHSVAIVDDNDNFISVAALSTMHDHFPQKNFPKWTNLFLDYTDDKEALKIATARSCFGSARRELPILQDGKVVATGYLSSTENADNDENSEKEPVEIKWEIISDDVAKTVLFNRKRILLSSTNGFLKGFVERFNGLFDIDVFDDSLLDKYLNGEYDILVYEADIWNNAVSPKYSALRLYNNMLAEEVRRYLVNNNVSYYFAKISDLPQNYDWRMKYKPMWPIKSSLGGESFNYLLILDYNMEGCHIIDGKRITTNHPKEYEYKVHFYGPCTAIGVIATDEETIQSNFQRIMNDNKCHGYAVNHGPGCTGPYIGINEFYRIMDTNFKEGDIVIHLGEEIWQILPDEEINWYINLERFYDTYSHQFDKIFTDNPAHLHPEGNQIVADALFEKLKPILSKPRAKNRKIVPSMFKTLIKNNIITPQKKFRLGTVPFNLIDKARKLPKHRRHRYELQSLYERSYAPCKICAA